MFLRRRLIVSADTFKQAAHLVSHYFQRFFTAQTRHALKQPVTA